MIPERIDAQVANIVAAADVLHEAVVSTDELLLSNEQIYELQRAQFKIAHILYAEIGVDAGAPEGSEGGEEDPPSLTNAQELAKAEGEQRDEMNELPAP